MRMSTDNITTNKSSYFCKRCSRHSGKKYRQRIFYIFSSEPTLSFKISVGSAHTANFRNDDEGNGCKHKRQWH